MYFLLNAFFGFCNASLILIFIELVICESNKSIWSFDVEYSKILNSKEMKVSFQIHAKKFCCPFVGCDRTFTSEFNLGLGGHIDWCKKNPDNMNDEIEDSSSSSSSSAKNIPQPRFSGFENVKSSRMTHAFGATTHHPVAPSPPALTAIIFVWSAPAPERMVGSLLSFPWIFRVQTLWLPGGYIGFERGVLHTCSAMSASENLPDARAASMDVNGMLDDETPSPILRFCLDDAISFGQPRKTKYISEFRVERLPGQNI